MWCNNDKCFNIICSVDDITLVRNSDSAINKVTLSFMTHFEVHIDQNIRRFYGFTVFDKNKLLLFAQKDDGKRLMRYFKKTV